MVDKNKIYCVRLPTPLVLAGNAGTLFLMESMRCIAKIPPTVTNEYEERFVNTPAIFGRIIFLTHTINLDIIFTLNVPMIRGITPFPGIRRHHNTSTTAIHS